MTRVDGQPPDEVGESPDDEVTPHELVSSDEYEVVEDDTGGSGHPIPDDLPIDESPLTVLPSDPLYPIDAGGSDHRDSSRGLAPVDSVVPWSPSGELSDENIASAVSTTEHTEEVLTQDIQGSDLIEPASKPGRPDAPVRNEVRLGNVDEPLAYASTTQVPPDQLDGGDRPHDALIDAATAGNAVSGAIKGENTPSIATQPAATDQPPVIADSLPLSDGTTRSETLEAPKERSSLTSRVRLGLERLTSTQVVVLAGCATLVLVGVGLLVGVALQRTPPSPPANGSLMIATKPDAACTVFVGGKPKGLLAAGATSVVQDLRPGPHRVSVRCVGYEDSSRMVTVKPSEVTFYRASLRKSAQ